MPNPQGYFTGHVRSPNKDHLMKRHNNGQLRHGHALRDKRSAEYECWIDMRTRCLNSRSTWYRRYGGRGIKMCERWLNSFEAFLKDMGLKPSPQHTIERIDNDGDYSPENCRWGTRKEQAANRSTRSVLELNGECKSLTEWAATLGMDKRRIHYRINVLGWSVEKALTTPLRSHKPYERRVK